MRYTNPLTGGYPMTTIGAFIQLLPKGSRRRRTARPTPRCSSPSKAAAAPASARLRRRMAAARHLRRAELEAGHARGDDDAVLFSFSDRPIQEALQLFREDRPHA